MAYNKDDFNFYDKNPRDESKLVNNDIFDDLFKDIFDRTWQRNLPDNDPSRVFSIIDPELKSGAIDDNSITYQYNEDFFRADPFTKNHDGKHILFGGCSETEGVGGNIEDSWSHMLYSKISKEEKCSGFFNLGKSGWGWSRLIINSLFFLINWKTFCELCKSNNVKLIFSTWDRLDSDNLKHAPFDEFFELEHNAIEKYFDKYYETNEVRKNDYQKRDGHSGRIFHSFYAKEFYAQYKKRGF